MKRRANREGSITLRKDGRWHARLSVNGRRLSYYAHTQRECQAWLLEMRHQQGEGLLTEAGRTLLSDYLAYWLQTVKVSLRPKSWVQYEAVCRLHIIPALGETPLEELRPVQLQAVYNRHLRQDGKASRTAQLMHAILHRALSQAVRWQMITRNPVDAVDAPRPPRREMRSLSVDEVGRLLEAARGDRLEVLWALAVHTGMRLGELLGLRWMDVDFERAEVRVQRQLYYVPHQGLVFADLKTGRSRRSIALGPAMVAALRHQRGAALGDLVFPSTVGTPLSPRNVERAFHALLRKAGLPDIRFHDLRHTSASLMLAQGVHLKVAQERLGHTDPMITAALYSHISADLQRQAARAIEEATGIKKGP